MRSVAPLAPAPGILVEGQKERGPWSLVSCLVAAWWWCPRHVFVSELELELCSAEEKKKKCD